MACRWRSSWTRTGPRAPFHTRPVRPSERLGEAIPSALEEVVLSCLEKDPERRPRDARALGDALDAAGVEPWTEENARAWWAARAARRMAEGGTALSRDRLPPAPTPSQTGLTPVKIDVARP